LLAALSTAEGHLDKLLADLGKVSRVRRHRALPIDEMPGFIARLSDVGGMGARALMFGILMAARWGKPGAPHGARWTLLAESEQHLQSA